jgi:GH35 family endo-1,4-beta-xylanase
VAAALLLLPEGVLLVLVVVDVGFWGVLDASNWVVRDSNLRVDDSLRPRRVDVVKKPRPRMILLVCAVRRAIMDRADIILLV